MVETDDTKLHAKMNAAEAAIFDRLQTLSGATNSEERTALDDAIRSLRILKRGQFSPAQAAPIETGRSYHRIM
jgi:multidrug efflux pump subunit AcrA (membrane-fusion protein)